MSAILALFSGAMFGIADFCAGLGTRSVGPYRFTAWTQIFALPVLLVGAWLVGAEDVAASGIVIGGAAGVLYLTGLLALYSALAAGTMSTVAPITGLLTIVIPVAWGIATGDGVTGIKWLGMAAAVVGVMLIARDHRHARLTRRVAILAVVGGIAFAGFFVALDIATDGAGMWPLVAARAVTLPLGFIAAYVATRTVARPPRTAMPFVAATGLLEGLANLFVVGAIQTGPISIAVVLIGMYPVFTALAAVGFLRERPTKAQWGGIALAFCASAILVV